jgi:hypothetical protein
MARLNPADVRKILQILEDGINLMPKLNKMEKMKMRSKIRKQFNWLSGLSAPNADMIFHKSYPYGFSDKVKKLLEERSARFRSM